MPATFDGINLRIILPASTPDIDVEVDLYSDWKEWLKLSDNSKFPPAFDTTGGDPTTATETVAPFFFLRNDLGWRIRGPEENATITLTGNLFGREPSLPILVPTLGSFTQQITTLVSSRALVSATDIIDLDGAIEAGLTLREAMRLIAAATAGKVSGAEGTNPIFRNAVADSKNRINATVDASGNRTAITYDLSD